MKFRMIVTDERGKEWSEDEDRVAIESLDEAEAWAKETVKSFNDTLRPHETPRKIVRVELPPDGDTETEQHDWDKTSLTTVKSKYFGMHDIMKCRSCGITGKRFGLGPHVRIDNDFKAAGFLSCKQAKVLMARRAEKRRKAKPNG